MSATRSMAMDRARAAPLGADATDTSRHALTRHASALIAAALVLAGCSSQPPAPDWQAAAKTASERAVAAYLTGNARVEAAELARARSEVARTGRPDLLARVELAQCAARVASLVFGPCAAFEPWRADAPPPERAYAAYLAGRATAEERALLPAAHRAGAASATADPLARLIAAGVQFESGQADPASIALAIDTASAQGWRRPLLAWLGVQLKRAEAAGAGDEVARLKRRISIVEGATVDDAVNQGAANQGVSRDGATSEATNLRGAKSGVAGPETSSR